MAQVKIYALSAQIDRERLKISEAIHNSVMTALEYPPEKKFHRFIRLDPADFIFPCDRSKAYTIVEISIFEGRSESAKKLLIRELFKNFELIVGTSPHDIEITIFDTPKSSWGIRGKPAEELSLDYKVEV